MGWETGSAILTGTGDPGRDPDHRLGRWGRHSDEGFFFGG